MDRWLEQLKDGKYLDEDEVRQLCSRVKEIMADESNVIRVSAPVTVCGDVHGQFYDVLELFRNGGQVPDTSYVFMVSART